MLCAEDEQGRTCWMTACRLLKVRGVPRAPCVASWTALPVARQPRVPTRPSKQGLRSYSQRLPVRSELTSDRGPCRSGTWWGSERRPWFLPPDARSTSTSETTRNVSRCDRMSLGGAWGRGTTLAESLGSREIGIERPERAPGRERARRSSGGLMTSETERHTLRFPKSRGHEGNVAHSVQRT